MNLSSNIVLIGFMGSGKSTVGRILARELDTFFIDSDTLIEAREGRDIPRIFSENGEAYFRQLECQCVEWMSRSLKGSVISTGGGLPIHAEGLPNVGRIIFLKSDIDTLIKRIGSDETNKRPLAEQPEQIRGIYDSRLATYEKISELTVNATRRPEEVANEILTRLFPDRTA